MEKKHMRNMYYKLLGLVMILTLLSLPALAGNHKTITATELKTRLAKKKFFLLDVHIPEQAHINGTDAFIDFRKIRQSTHRLPSDKEAEIVVYCLGGGMSRAAAEDLLEMGYTNVHDLEGGVYAFNRLLSK
jgi:rhodanese-related sulfurtransferase